MAPYSNWRISTFWEFVQNDSYGTFELSGWSVTVIIGVICLIIGLAVYEGFGWLGGPIMGAIETFGLLANTLSYLRIIMAVGVAGVKIAEIGNEMGFHGMADAITAGDYLLVLPLFILWIDVQKSPHWLLDFYHQVFTQSVYTSLSGWASSMTAPARSSNH